MVIAHPNDETEEISMGLFTGARAAREAVAQVLATVKQEVARNGPITEDNPAYRAADEHAKRTIAAAGPIVRWWYAE